MSVIVPVYNIAPYLKSCVRSVLEQTYLEIEVLLVDDGSTDSSGEICEDFAKLDRRVRVFHQVNAGLSAARNTAIDAARGELILCIDGDDVVSRNHLQNLVAAFDEEGVDISTADFVTTLQSESYPAHSSPKRPSEFLDKESALIRLFNQDGVTNSAWAKLYRASLFDGIRYPVGALYEDLPVTYRLFDRARRVALTHDPSYFYVQRDSSITALRQWERRAAAIDFATVAIADTTRMSPQVQSAARARAFMETVFFLSDLPSGRTIPSLPERVLAPLRKYRRDALTARGARPINRMFALSAYFGPRVVRQVAIIRARLRSLVTRHQSSR